MIIDDPQVLSEVGVVLDRDEAALMDNDIAALESLSRRAPQTSGSAHRRICDGFEAIAAFRRVRPGSARTRQRALALWKPDS